jgi:hypothetical protein
VRDCYFFTVGLHSMAFYQEENRRICVKLETPYTVCTSYKCSYYYCCTFIRSTYCTTYVLTRVQSKIHYRTYCTLYLYMYVQYSTCTYCKKYSITRIVVRLHFYDFLLQRTVIECSFEFTKLQYRIYPPHIERTCWYKLYTAIFFTVNIQ